MHLGPPMPEHFIASGLTVWLHDPEGCSQLNSMHTLHAVDGASRTLVGLLVRCEH